MPRPSFLGLPKCLQPSLMVGLVWRAAGGNLLAVATVLELTQQTCKWRTVVYLSKVSLNDCQWSNVVPTSKRSGSILLNYRLQT